MAGGMIMVKVDESRPVRQGALDPRDPAGGPGPVPAGPCGAEHLPAAGGDESELPKFGWRDVFAFTIAAYQLLLPILLACFGLLLAIYLLLRYL